VRLGLVQILEDIASKGMLALGVKRPRNPYRNCEGGCD
jgi:hypothetical protein